MTRRERLMATLRGEPVDRPPVCFYGVGDPGQDPTDSDPFNVYNDPSWRPLLELARAEADLIVMRRVPFVCTGDDPMKAIKTSQIWNDGNGSRFFKTTIRAGERELTALNRQDRDLNTIWTVEHLLKDTHDLTAWLELPHLSAVGEPDVRNVLETEARLEDAGIVMLETPDPFGLIAGLFHMADYTLIGVMENALMHRALERVLEYLLRRVEAVCRKLPGRLWRIAGPEYAAPPYLPPHLFEEYVVRYVTPIIKAIQRDGGYARLHSHGRLLHILDHIAATGCDALDPIEPPPLGDVDLEYVRTRYGKQMVLFGNLQGHEVFMLPSDVFAAKVAKALQEGTQGEGRGFVLTPSDPPVARKLPDRVVRNHETMVMMARQFQMPPCASK